MADISPGAVQQHEDRRGLDLPIGAKHYRAWVGPTANYDRVSALQFNLLTFLGLREDHYLLDIGCGSLRGGKLFIPYLLPEHYFGIEPEQWAIEEGIAQEIGQHQIDLKRPRFSNDRDFSLGVFGQQFDFILAQSIFSHASQAQIRRCLGEARKVMRPGAIFVANYGIGEEDYTGDEWVYPGGVNYTPERMAALAAEQGLFCQPIHWPHPNGLSWIVLARPEDRDRVPPMSDSLPALQRELDLARRRLAEIQGHPLVALGLRVNQALRKGLRRVRGAS